MSTLGTSSGAYWVWPPRDAETTQLPIDNRIYDQDAAMWWSEDGHLALLRGMIGARLDYLEWVRDAPIDGALAGKDVLDVGCGGGLFAEALAGLGCRVTGIDPSAASIDEAVKHASRAGLDVRYVVGDGEGMPFDAGSFDVVVCCDVLEHVRDVSAVLSGCATVLRPGGLFLYDTINRTWLSKLFLVNLFQNWKPLAIMRPDAHVHEQFIEPEKMVQMLRDAGIEPGDQKGLAVDMGPLASCRRLAAIIRLKRGTGTYQELAEFMEFHLGGPLWMNYIGHGTRR